MVSRRTGARLSAIAVVLVVSVAITLLGYSITAWLNISSQLDQGTLDGVLGRVLAEQGAELRRIREGIFLPPRLPSDPSRGRCSEPKMSVAFAKTHKTGSSTLQNIFLRFGVNHDLTFAFPDRSWMFKLNATFNSSLVLKGDFSSLGFDMFVSHSIWSYQEVKKVVPNAIFVTLLRDPVECFESNFVFMGVADSLHMDVNHYAKHRIHDNDTRKVGAYVGRNQLLWDLGMDLDKMNDREAVLEAIEEYDKQFDLVLITERFQDSIVLMRDLLCWDFYDVVSFSQLERVGGRRSNMTEESRALLKEWLWADYLLYDHFVAKLERQIEAFGQDRLEADKKRLSETTDIVKQECIKSKVPKEQLKNFNPKKKGIVGVYAYEIDENKTSCAPFVRSETEFAYQIRAYQRLKAQELFKIRGDCGLQKMFAP